MRDSGATSRRPPLSFSDSLKLKTARLCLHNAWPGLFLADELYV